MTLKTIFDGDTSQQKGFNILVSPSSPKAREVTLPASPRSVRDRKADLNDTLWDGQELVEWLDKVVDVQ